MRHEVVPVVVRLNSLVMYYWQGKNDKGVQGGLAQTTTAAIYGAVQPTPTEILIQVCGKPPTKRCDLDSETLAKSVGQYVVGISMQ